MSLQKSLSTTANKFDKSVDGFVKNDTSINILRAGLLGYALFVKNVPDAVINAFDNFAVRLVTAGMCAYLLFKDVVTALLLSLCFIMTVLELKNRRGGVVPMANQFNNGPSPNPMATASAPPPVVRDAGNEAGNFPNPEDSPDPAFRTMTQNIVEGSFTSDAQLRDAQSNMIQGVDPDAGVKTFSNQHGAQGLDVPLGFDPESCEASAF